MALTKVTYSLIAGAPINLVDYGCVADGVTDNTVAFNSVITYINANPGTVVIAERGSYVLGLTNAITADNTVFLMDGVTFLSKPDSMVLNDDSMITVTADNFQMVGATFDGNQANYAAGTGCQLFTLTGSGHKLHRCKFVQSPGRGAILSCSESEFVDCNFDYNANLGHESAQASYLKFIGCTWNVNGCGFQKTRTVPADSSHDFDAFGNALRFNSHHIEFIDCEAKLNGREGFYCGQGTYAIKYIGCLAWANDDGGFTLNRDPLSTGLPGDGDSCYDIEYIDCESYDNWSSGFVATYAVTNVSIIGGRYYNNHRLAGSLVEQSAYANGIFFAGNSQGIVIDGAKAYDERQFRQITAASVSGSSCVVTATGWVPGTKDYYPIVAFIAGSDGSFQGYGKIIAESAGSVTVETMPQNGVTLGSISSAWYVTQRIQHTGILCDNGSLGYVNADMFGEVKGPTTTGTNGFKVFIGFNANGQNVIVDNGVEKLEPELLANPTFDVDILNWTFNTPGGGSATRITAGIQKSAASLRLIGGSSSAEGDATLITNALDHLLGSYFRYGIWAYASARADATLSLFWTIGGTPFSTSAVHPGGGWRYLMVAGYIPVGTTAVTARVVAAIGKTTYWDTGSLRAYSLKTDSRDLDPNSRSLPV
jgi:hypothetical protein